MQKEVSRSAPVVESAEIVIDAPLEVVWKVISDFEKWPDWNSAVTRMDFRGPLTAGTSFEWVGGGSKIVSRLEEVDPYKRLVWSGKTFGIHAVHVWKFDRSDTGTCVFTEESFEGFIARIIPGVMRKMLAKALREGLTALKIASESRERASSA